MDAIVSEIANLGFTILCIGVGIIVVRWFDKNVFNKGRKKD